ncbi:MAG: hypothetical protein N2654_07660, partial [Deltaproteobacteria bacterium]|nr:hypothetical protein [Deltaproteobacteria bacterium]
MPPRFNNPTPIEELHSSSNKDLAVSCSKKRASSSSRILFERLRLQVEKIRVSLIKRLRSGRRQNGLVPTIGSHLLENHDRHEHFCKTADLVGFAGSSLCAMKCAFLGILMGAGLASSSAGIFYGLTKLVHSPYLVLGLTFVSVISAFKGLLYPMYKHLVHSRMVRNQTAFLTGMAGVASVFFIIGVQMFSGIV